MRNASRALYFISQAWLLALDCKPERTKKFPSALNLIKEKEQAVVQYHTTLLSILIQVYKFHYLINYFIKQVLRRMLP